MKLKRMESVFTGEPFYAHQTKKRMSNFSMNEG